MPFISHEGVDFLIDSLGNRIHKREPLSMKVITCDSPQAYRQGFLDPQALLRLTEECHAEIAAFGEGLHAKVILVDKSIAIVTSANLTLVGLKGNYEIGLKTTDKEIVERLSTEFDIAWDAAEELSSKDLRARLDWRKKAGPPGKEIEPSFRTKIRWRSVVTAGTGSFYGVKIFRGFTKDDFEALNPETYGGLIDDDPISVAVVESIKDAIKNRSKPLLSKVYLAIKDYLPAKEHLYPHFASRKRVKNFYPSAAWLGLGRDERRYVTLAQLSVGLFVDGEGIGLFTNFNIGEEYEINEDKAHFLDWLSKNIPLFTQSIKTLNPAFYLYYSHPDKDTVVKPVREVTVDDLKEVLGIPRDHLLNFHLERKYMIEEEWDLLRRSRVVFEVADQFEVLYPIYLNAFGGRP